MANLIPKITKMLGVELGEKFKIDIRGNDIFQITESGIWMEKDVNKDEWVEMPFEFMMLCNGDAEVVKLPWKPKEDTEVYTFSFTTHEYNSRFCPHKGVWYVTKWNWAGFPWQIAALDKGWVFRSKQEAEAALPAVAAEMGVEYELPTSDTEAVEEEAKAALPKVAAEMGVDYEL